MTETGGATPDTDGTGRGTVDTRSDWLDADRYPFDAHWFDAGPGRMHYVDGGDANDDHAVVALHGNPTWSFIYRRLVRRLAPEYRVLAPDLLGFGLSDVPADFSYRAPAQAALVADFLDSLDAAELTLVVHDWGGPMGLSYAMDNPDRVRSLVVCNTFCWPADRDVVKLFSHLTGRFPGLVACERYNAFARWLMPMAFAEETRFPPALRRHYTVPLARAPRRTGTWRFPRDLTAARDWLADRWARRETIADLPALLVWGMEDAVLGEPALDRFESLFRNGRTERLEDVSHYVPEEGGERFVDRAAAFLAETG